MKQTYTTFGSAEPFLKVEKVEKVDLAPPFLKVEKVED